MLKSLKVADIARLILAVAALVLALWTHAVGQGI